MGEIQLPKNNLNARGILVESPINQYKAKEGNKTNSAVMIKGDLNACSTG